MIVTFCGHREIQDREAVAQWLTQTCEELIRQGANTFYLGGYGAFDHLAARTLREMKKQHAQIKLVLVLPYMNHKFPAGLYDETVYSPLEHVPLKYAILRRNEWLAEQADVLLACVTHDWGGAWKTMRYAQKKGKKVIWYGISS